MRTPLSVDRLAQAETHSLVELYRVCFGRDRTSGYFQWKYFQNPAGDAVCFVIRAGDGLAASCVMIPEPFSVLGQRQVVYKCCDLMVHPEFRKQGMGTALIRALGEHLREQQACLMYTLCSKNATGGFVRSGWTRQAGVLSFFKHRYQLRLESSLRRTAPAECRPIASVEELCRQYPFATHRGRIGFVRDEAVLRWRLAHPLYTYRIVGCYERSTLNGYAVTNTGIRGNVFLVDLGTRGDDPAIHRALLQEVENEARRSTAKSVIGLAVQGTDLSMQLKKARYMWNPFERGPLCSALDFNVWANQAHEPFGRSVESWAIVPLNYDDV